MLDKPIVSVIIVNYNGGDRLYDHLSKIMTDRLSPPFEVFFVDNASVDGSSSTGIEFEGRYPNFHFLASEINLGYAGGINLAWPHCKSDFVAVLNMDVQISHGWLTPLADFLESHPTAAAINPLILLKNDPERINAVGQSVHVTALGFNRALGRNRDEIAAEPVEISGIQGGVFIIRRELLQEMDGLDETGFLYHEDVDLSWLLLIKGYQLYCIPASVVYHDYYLTMYPEKLYLLERNRLAMLLAYLKPSTIFLMSPWLLFTELLMWGYCLLRGWKFIKAKAGSYRWVWRHANHHRARKEQVERQRKRGDWQVLKKLDWSYSWDQFITLGRERGFSTRQPRNELPIEIP